ncbi:MAG TPA: DUF4304 domain-containing protein [Candidatus Acidoferrum sp.]
MSEIAKQIKAIADLGLAPLLKQAGFRKRGTHYARVKGEALQLINVQSSQWNMSSQGRFTLNIGVHFSSVAKMLMGADRMPAVPKHYYCLRRKRVGQLLPDKADRWWTVAPQTNASDVAAELSSAMNDYVLPWLTKVETISGVAMELERGPDPLSGGLWTAPAARLVLGEPERAGELARTMLDDLSNELKSCHPGNKALLTSHIEKLNQWVVDHNLLGFTKAEKAQ